MMMVKNALIGANGYVLVVIMDIAMNIMVRIKSAFRVT